MAISAVRRALVVLFATLLLSGSATTFAQTTLEWKFQAQQQFAQTIQQDMQMTSMFGANNFTIGMKQTVYASWTIKAVDAAGTADIDQQIQRLQMKMSGPTGFEFDSAGNAEPTGIGALMAPALKAMAQAKFQIKMTKNGEILAVEMAEETVQALQKIPGANQMGNLLSKDSLVAMIKQGTPSFPGKPVMKGDQWTNTLETELPQIGKMKNVVTSTYDGPTTVGQQNFEKILLAMNMSIVPKEGGQGPQVTVSAQDAQGALYFDNAAGRLHHSDLTQNTTLTIAVAGQMINQKIAQTIAVTFAPKPQ